MSRHATASSTMTRTRDHPRGRYSDSHTSPEPFSDEFYRTRRRGGRLAMLTTLPTNVYKASVAKFGRRRGPALLCFCCLALLLSTYTLHQRFVSSHRAWPGPWRGSKAAVFGRDELRKIWDWEVRSGHYPSTRPSESVRPSPPSVPMGMCAYVLTFGALWKFRLKWDSLPRPKTQRCRRARTAGPRPPMSARRAQDRSEYIPTCGIDHQSLDTLHDLYPAALRTWTRFSSNVISAQAKYVRSRPNLLRLLELRFNYTLISRSVTATSSYDWARD